MKTRCLNSFKSLHLLISILFFSFCSNLVEAQENFKPGYIIKQNRDTIKGFIDYRNWDKNPFLIKFKTEINAQEEAFDPLSIQEFNVEDEVYVSGIIKVETTPLKTDELTENAEFKIKKDTTFLQALFQGDKSLYYYRNEDKRDNFYILKGDEYELLKYKRFIKNKNGQKAIVENKAYLGQLTSYLDDCSTIYAEIVHARYRQKELYRIFEYYKECIGENFLYQKKEKKIQKHFGVVSGASLSMLNFKSVANANLVNTDYDSSFRPVLGLYIDFILPRHQRKWSIYNELLLTNYNISGVYEDYTSDENFSISTTEFKYTYLRVNNLVRFKYPVGSMEIFVNGGISNSLVIGGSNFEKKEIKFFVDERVLEREALPEIRRYEQGFILGTGVKYKNYTFELRAEGSNGMSVYTVLTSNVNRFYLLVGYRF